jgi:threonine dehydratase
MELNLKKIEDAADRLNQVTHWTKLESSTTLSRLSGGQVYLKYENQQKTGSFKIRGAYNKIATLLESRPVTSVVASSAGNHAQGVAYAATQLGIKSTIVMPRSTPIAKVSATEDYGANVVLYGDCYDDAYTKAIEIQKETEGEFIHPFDDIDVIAGQATVGLEILKDLPTIDILCVPAGGGGLLSGIAYYIKNINPRVKIVGVQSEGASAICQSFKKNEVCCLENVQTIADGIAVKRPGCYTQKIINKYVDEMVTVPDGEVAAAILTLLERNKQIVEPAGAASLTAVINGKVDVKDKKVACVLSGGNIDVGFIHRIIEKGLVTRGRRMKFKTQMLDVPGSLEKFAKIVAEAGANIVMVQHDKLHAGLNLNEAILHVACEVSGDEHSRLVVSSLEENGYKVIME